MAKNKKSWSELPARKRGMIIAGGVLQFGLLVAALSDLRRRPADEINGSKAQWTALSFVNFIGPIAYFTVGRKH